MKLYRYFFNTYNNFNIEVKEIPVEKETPGTYQINFAGRKQILKSKTGVALTDWVTYGAECFLLQKNLPGKTIIPERFSFTYDNIRIIKRTFYDFTVAITSVSGKDS